MVAAIILTIVGTGALFGLGTTVLALDIQQLVVAWIAANVFGALDLVFTLELQRLKILRGTLVTWIFFMGFWMGGQIGVSPFLRDWHSWLYLFLPLCMCTGPCIVIWGPFQDWLVARRQKVARGK